MSNRIEIRRRLLDAVRAQNADAFELAVRLAFQAGLLSDVADIFSDAILLSWHHSHEDLASALQETKYRPAVDSLFKVALSRPDYLEYDESFALARKSIWALADIGTPEAMERLRDLARSQNTVVAGYARKRLDRWREERPRKQPIATHFRQLNDGWNADPNAPEPAVQVDGGNVVLDFFANALVEGQRYRLRFKNARRYRLGTTNDEGWYKGQCRFSLVAPNWGEFYEVSGDLRLDRCPNDWHAVGGPQASGRHYLFYFRDDTFECEADDWTLASGSFDEQKGAASEDVRRVEARLTMDQDYKNHPRAESSPRDSAEERRERPDKHHLSSNRVIAKPGKPDGVWRRRLPECLLLLSAFLVPSWLAVHFVAWTFRVSPAPWDVTAPSWGRAVGAIVLGLSITFGAVFIFLRHIWLNLERSRGF
jgi:hypothetical protein